MKLWLLRPIKNLKNDPWEPWYDKAFGFVVRAETEEDARKLANEQGGSECGPVSNRVYRTGGDPWLDSSLSTCTELTENGEQEVVIRDYAAA